MWTAIFITIDLGFGSTVLQGPPFSILRCPPLLPLRPPSMILFLCLVFLVVCSHSLSLCLFFSLQQQQRPTDTADAELNWSPCLSTPISAALSALRRECHGTFDYLNWYCRKLQRVMQYICWDLLFTSGGKNTQRVWCERQFTTHTVSGRMGVIIQFYSITVLQT